MSSIVWRAPTKQVRQEEVMNWVPGGLNNQRSRRAALYDLCYYGRAGV